MSCDVLTKIAIDSPEYVITLTTCVAPYMSRHGHTASLECIARLGLRFTHVIVRSFD